MTATTITKSELFKQLSQPRASATANTVQQPDTATGSDKLQADYQTFLKLLTTQMNNQDPTKPMDATQFVTQLAQFSQVEQGVQTNKNLSSIMASLKSSAQRFDLAFLGRRVEAATDTFGLKDGTATVAFSLDADAASARITVKDTAGRAVRTVDVDRASGRHEFVWNGVGDDGVKRPDGTYTFSIVAKDKGGTDVKSATVVSETVKEVLRENGETRLVLSGGARISPDEVLKVAARQ